VCNLQVKLCDPHLSALEVRFSRRGTIQIYVYLYVYFYKQPYSNALLTPTNRVGVVNKKVIAI